MAAATGGVLGAGLGAIVGSQTGSAGGGLVLGALAGGAAGGAVGNALEAQEKTIRTQDEAIERQERTIAAQRTELEELRNMNQEQSHLHLRPPAIQDPVPHASFGGTPQLRAPAQELRAPAHGLRRPPAASMLPSQALAQRPEENGIAAASPSRLDGPMRESTLIDRSADYQPIEPYKLQPPAQPKIASSNIGRVPPAVMTEERPQIAAQGSIRDSAAGRVASDVNALNRSAECIQAEGEVTKAGSSSELADKLFHYRRALRLCPDNPSYHNGLGEIYLALNRRADAEFEFREALNLDPNFTPAQSNLNNLQ